MSSHPDETARLRQRAKVFLETHPKALDNLGHQSALHELQVHQVELEMQNQELRETQAALTRARDRYFNLFDLAPAPYLLFNQDHGLAELNLAAAELLGRERSRLKGKAFIPHVTAEHRDLFHEHLNQAFESGRRQTIELRFKTEAGAIRHVLLTSLILPAELDATPLCLTSCVDLTERKKAETDLVALQNHLAQVNIDLERQVQERTAKLRETIEELEQYSYTITHDMRAPLRAMQGFAGLLLEEFSHHLDPDGRDYLRRIAEAADRMDRLITDALQFSGALRQPIRLEPVDPGVLLRGILESYPQYQPPRAHVHIIDGLPWVLGNKAAMTQCFSNLLDNAVKFVRPGITPEVRIWAGRQGGCARLWFQDNGIGIEKQYYDKIWVMFQRLNKDYEGTGIGLALVRKVVERMGGQVGVESEPGQGSRFWVQLKCSEGSS